MALFAVDIGNTNITLGLYDDTGTMTHRWALTSNPLRTTDEYRMFMRLLAAECPAMLEASEVVIGSVVPSLQLLMEDAFDQLLPNARRLVVSHTTPLPVANAYPVPSEVGIDRLANAVGGFHRFGASCIVVDFGTATTIDVLAPPLPQATDSRPRYLGGIILPGPRLAAEALNLRTARLPMVSPKPTERIIADNTVEAIRSGLFWGMVGAIDYLVQEAARESQLSTYVAVATGGLGRDFLGRCKTISHFEPELTLFGLHEIAQFQHNSDR